MIWVEVLGPYTCTIPSSNPDPFIVLQTLPHTLIFYLLCNWQCYENIARRIVLKVIRGKKLNSPLRCVVFQDAWRQLLRTFHTKRQCSFQLNFSILDRNLFDKDLPSSLMSLLLSLSQSLVQSVLQIFSSRSLKDYQPAYLADLLVRLKCSKYLRSTNSNNFVVPHIKTKTRHYPNHTYGTPCMCQYVMPRQFYHFYCFGLDYDTWSR